MQFLLHVIGSYIIIIYVRSTDSICCILSVYQTVGRISWEILKYITSGGGIMEDLCTTISFYHTFKENYPLLFKNLYRKKKKITMQF